MGLEVGGQRGPCGAVCTPRTFLATDRMVQTRSVASGGCVRTQNVETGRLRGERGSDMSNETIHL